MTKLKLFDAIHEPVSGVRQDTLILLILGLILLVFIALCVLRVHRDRRNAAPKPEETKEERKNDEAL